MRGCVCVCVCVWGGGGCWNNERNGGVCFAELICLHVWWGWERARVFEG